MNVIRYFLWTLVGVMTLQGFLQADEYGSAPTLFGGIGLALSIWRESAGAATRSWFVSTPAFVGLPRAIVQAAVTETSLHPGIQDVPKLKQTLKAHQRTWDLFREEEINWLLRHADLIGAVLSDPEAVQLWDHWSQRLNYSQNSLEKARAAVCTISILPPSGCEQANKDVSVYEARVEYITTAVRAWHDVLYIGRLYSAHRWLTDIHEHVNDSAFSTFYTGLARLYDIETPTDIRINTVLADRRTIHAQGPWIQRILTSLLEGEVWTACLEHVRLREGRVRELMMVAGIQDMVNAHERTLNATLRVVTTTEEKRLVQEWFGEMAGYAWFLPDSLPSLVRRCISQDAGDCTRIGPIEIVTLTEKEVKRTRIIGDWSRRLFIGMWNAMPAVCILFIVELILLCMPTRYARPQTFVLDRRAFQTGTFSK